MPASHLRPGLARDGIFNLRDLGGTPAADETVVAERLLVRADALHRSSAATVQALHDHGIRRVLDLRDDSERDLSGAFTVVDDLDIEVRFVPVLDPTYEWDLDGVEMEALLAHRYEDILTNFGDRLADAVTAIADADGGVAFHCAVGKDRTGLLAMLVLGALGAADEVIVADYARSSLATGVQVQWIRTLGLPHGPRDDEEMATGVWSARAVTMQRTLDHLDRDHGGVTAYLRGIGVDDDALDLMRSRLLVDPDLPTSGPPSGPSEQG